MSQASPPATTLQSLRERIDAADAELLTLLNRRAQLALEVGELKKREGSVVFRPEREAQVIDGLKARNSGPLKTDSIAPIWREIMSACRALETPTRVAYLGPAGTFSCLLYTSDAADERSSVDLGGRRIIKKKKKTNQQRGAGYQRERKEKEQ